MRSTLDLISSRAVPPLAFLGDGFGILEAIVIIIVVTTAAFLCLVAYDLNTDFRRFDKRDAKRAAAIAAGTSAPKRPRERTRERRPATAQAANKAVR